MPARFWPPTFTAVSSAPHTVPLAYATCCMRESLAFRLPFGGPKVVLSWLPTPATVVLQLGRITVSAMHCDSGRLSAGCFARGGTAYVSTASVDRPSVGAGEGELSEDVFNIVHSRMLLLVPESENPERELRKNAVPPLSVSN